MSPRRTVSALLATGVLVSAAALPAAADAAPFRLTSKAGAGSQVTARGTVTFTSARRATVAGTLTDICPGDGWGALLIVDALTSLTSGDPAGRISFGKGCESGGVPFTIKAKTTKGPLRMVAFILCEARNQPGQYAPQLTRDCTKRRIIRG